MHQQSVSTEIIDIAKQLYTKNCLAAADGNISYRLDNDTILITPSGVRKAFMTPDDMAVINLQGDILSGTPSSEQIMHLTVYRQCPEAKAIVHAHPPTAIAWSIAFPETQELPHNCMSELLLACGGIPITPYARPGTKAMGEALLPHLPQHRLLILARHGALAWGETLEEAVMGIERVEHSAEILYKAQCLGGLSHLPAEEVSALVAMRKKLGERLL